MRAVKVENSQVGKLAHLDAPDLRVDAQRAGAGVALLPGLPLIRLLVGVQVLNGCLLPVLLVFVLLLINDCRLAGDLRNGPVHNVLGWGTVALVTSAVVVLFLTNI